MTKTTDILPIGVKEVPLNEGQPLENFTVVALEGEKPDVLSHRVGSEYVEHEWLPFLGPLAVLFARRVDSMLSGSDNKVGINVKKVARDFGVTPAELRRCCHRLIRYGLAGWSARDATLVLSRHWPPVPMAILAEEHRAVLTDIADRELTR